MPPHSKTRKECPSHTSKASLPFSWSSGAEEASRWSEEEEAAFEVGNGVF